jgi:putative ABC transport system permease protein
MGRWSPTRSTRSPRLHEIEFVFNHIIRNLRLGLNSLKAHKLRSGLTVLGIVFGVASVIAMLAIGEGLGKEAREQIERLGSNNIILRSAKPPKSVAPPAGGGMNVITYGLTYADVKRIQSTIPRVEVDVPMREIRRDIWYQHSQADGLVIGTMPWHTSVSRTQLIAGRFITWMDMDSFANVCVITSSLAQKLGGSLNLVNDFVKFGPDYYKVVGICETMSASPSPEKGAPTQSAFQAFIPLSSAQARFGDLLVDRSAGSTSAEEVELHQVTIRVASSDDVLATSKAIETVLKRNHDKQDFEMIVPLQLLKEKERVKRLYNIVLGLMAAISLLVGGIGIMNIMLATVSERTREIGTRRAIGAKKRDIMAQFLTETVLLSGFGGMVGIALGIVIPMIITYVTHMTTLVRVWAVLLSFGISAMIGLFFGFYPAWRAANLDPIAALRHE